MHLNVYFHHVTYCKIFNESSSLPKNEQQGRAQEAEERQDEDMIILDKTLLGLELLRLDHLPPPVVFEHLHGRVEALLVLLSPAWDVYVVAGVEVVVEAVAQLAHAAR